MARTATLCAILLLACGVAEREVYQVGGVVRSVDRASDVVMIAHDAIPGLMPAMTMSFDVVSPELLEGLTPGSRVRFELERMPAVSLHPPIADPHPSRRGLRLNRSPNCPSVKSGRIALMLQSGNRCPSIP